MVDRIQYASELEPLAVTMTSARCPTPSVTMVCVVGDDRYKIVRHHCQDMIIDAKHLDPF